MTTKSIYQLQVVCLFLHSAELGICIAQRKMNPSLFVVGHSCLTLLFYSRNLSGYDDFPQNDCLRMSRDDFLYVWFKVGLYSFSDDGRKHSLCNCVDFAFLHCSARTWIHNDLKSSSDSLDNGTVTSDCD